MASSIVDYVHLYPGNSQAFSNAAAVGDVIVVIATSHGYSTTCTDDLGNVYRMIVGVDATFWFSASGSVAIFVGLVVKPGTPTVTVTNTSDVGVDAWIVRGVRPRINGYGSGTGSAVPQAFGSSISTTRRCAFFGGWSDEGKGGNFFTSFVDLDGAVTTDNHDSGHYSAVGHRLAVPAGTYTPGVNLSSSDPYGCCAGIFLEELLDGDPYLIDYADSGARQTSFPMTLSMTVDAADRRLVLAAALGGTSIDSADWNGTSLTEITGTAQNASGNRTKLFDLANPATGSHTLTCNVTGGTSGWLAGYLIGTYGSGYTAPTQDVGDGTTASSASSISKATSLAQANELSIDIWATGNTGANPVPDSPQANGRKLTSPSFFEAATSMAHIAASGSNTDGWTNDSATALALSVAYFKGGSAGGGDITAALAGAGSLAAALLAAAALQAGLAGLGTVVATLRGAASGVAALAGAGSLTASLSGAAAAQAALAGQGSLVAQLDAAAAIVCQMAGAGTVAATCQDANPTVCTMAGQGSLVASLTAAGAMQCAMAGHGTLTGTLSGGTPTTSTGNFDCDPTPQLIVHAVARAGHASPTPRHAFRRGA